MKRAAFLISASLLCGAAFAQQPAPAASAAQAIPDRNNLPGRLLDAASGFELADLQAYLDRGLDTQRMELNERVASVGMGTREAQEMREEDAVRGADHSKDTPTAKPYEDSLNAGQVAWDAWKPGKTQSQIAAGKKLYAAWLTYMQTLETWPGNPLDFDQTPAGIAWTQAMNEFKVDTL